MMNEERELRVALRMTPKQAREFAEKLAEDDEFRSRLEEAPHEVLGEYGIDIARELLPEQVTLPSKREVSELHEAARGNRDLRVEPDGIRMWPGLFFVFAIAAQER